MWKEDQEWLYFTSSGFLSSVILFLAKHTSFFIYFNETTEIGTKCVAKGRNADAKWKHKCCKAHCFCHKDEWDNDSLFAIFWHSIHFVFSDFIFYWWPTAKLGINFSASVVLSWGEKPDLNLCFLPRVALHSEGGVGGWLDQLECKNNCRFPQKQLLITYLHVRQHDCIPLLCCAQCKGCRKNTVVPCGWLVKLKVVFNS